MPSKLYQKDTYLNRNIELLTNETIIEYDLKSANTSLCREYSLLSEKEITKLEDMPKQKRVVKIGNKMRENPEFKEKLKASFVDIRRRFFELNEIEDGDILAIRKDAIFCLREVPVTEIGACNFVKKNVYTSFLRLGNLEIFYAPRFTEEGNQGIIHVKGIDDDVLKKHENHMLGFFRTLFKHLETSSREIQISYLRRFIDKYKLCRLDLGYYREFNSASVFRVHDSSTTYDNEAFLPENVFDMLDIDYNFSEIILPIVKIML